MAKNMFQRLKMSGMDQSRAFQCFVTGGITGMCGIGTLLLLETDKQNLASEITALLALLLAATGILMAAIGYARILILRLTQTTRTNSMGTEND
ncbi:hypothetical protein BTA51_25490 [Hahella sp. CCB-MM4]|uniref:hypothetical protein n=1 Tax=Hahella sp. (strain CCB-MM4) TaxID=1926491 RepID=UPI000B9B3A26|nr:hypothetical protein [Hahella sp. CCB-MM4]OZG70490.1 hypothetical protein BTA51_25490 [Hahella sp. CCB-MM4]